MQAFTNDVEIRGAFKKFGGTIVLDGINLDVRQGELLTLLGPSGCGKTTTLNLIAGFLDVDEGDVFIKGKRVNDVPPYKRDLGMVFQTYSLFPHMTVYENLSFGLSLHKVAKDDKTQRIQHALQLMKMTGLEDRYPRELSGGQRQRVAIARALVVQPTLLLLDEPLSSLDAKMRHELRAEIKRLQKEVGVTTIFVTHDQEEALSMSDRIVIMNQGKIEQVGTPTEIYANPQTEFVFQFIGKSNRLNGWIHAINNEMLTVKLEDGGLLFVKAGNIMGSDKNCTEGDPVMLYIRPEKATIDSNKITDLNYNQYTANITQMNYFGANWEIEVSLLGEVMHVMHPVIEPHWTIRSEVMVGWKPADVMVVKK